MRQGARKAQTRVLLVEPHPRDARRFTLVLDKLGGAMEPHGGGFTVTHVLRLESAVDLLGEGKRFDVALLDLPLDESPGLDALARLRAVSASLPIIVLTGADDEDLAVEAIQQGAQDWLPKADLGGRLLARTIRHAVERKRIETELLRNSREVEAARARIERQTAELAARAARLDAIHRDLDDFTYIASHDLKEPLQGIEAYCEILLEDYKDQIDKEGVRRLEAIVAMCERLADQIDHVLTYCRVGRAENPRHEVDLMQVLQGQLDAMRAVIDRRRARVEIVSVLPVVLGDAALLGTVLANLISNGLKYNESAAPRVEIGASLGDPCTIFVRDNGIGIEPRHHEEIFALFRRLHSRKKYDGTGAGLSIVKKIVERLGGRIWLESAPGRGSTFYVALPPAERPVPLPPPAPHWLSHAASPATR
ncbi:MAG: response regulator [Pirellulales bacterium]|nr:response regulator [Pirellulales bacterium]